MALTCRPYRLRLPVGLIVRSRSRHQISHVHKQRLSQIFRRGRSRRRRPYTHSCSIQTDIAATSILRHFLSHKRRSMNRPAMLRSRRINHRSLSNVGISVRACGVIIPLWPLGAGIQPFSMTMTARRSRASSLRKAARALLTSLSDPDSTARRNAMVVGWSLPQMKARALAKRSMAARSITASGTWRFRPQDGEASLSITEAGLATSHDLVRQEPIGTRDTVRASAMPSGLARR